MDCAPLQRELDIAFGNSSCEDLDILLYANIFACFFLI